MDLRAGLRAMGVGRVVARMGRCRTGGSGEDQQEGVIFPCRSSVIPAKAGTHLANRTQVTKTRNGFPPSRE